MTNITKEKLTNAPILKLERAKHHINELSGQINSYLSDNPFEFVIRDDPKANQRTYFVKTKKPIPNSFPLLIGDAVHNLRTALDILIFNMAGEKTPKPDAVQFPFCKDAVSLERTIEKRQIKFAGENVVNAIHALKPYPGGDELLCGLHSLDISDKHRLVITAVQIVEFSATELKKLGLPFDGGGSIRFTNQNGVLITSGLPRIGGRRMMASTYKASIQPVFQICFGNGFAFSHRPINTELHAMTMRVQETIDLLANEYITDRHNSLA